MYRGSNTAARTTISPPITISHANPLSRARLFWKDSVWTAPTNAAIPRTDPKNSAALARARCAAQQQAAADDDFDEAEGCRVGEAQNAHHRCVHRAIEPASGDRQQADQQHEQPDERGDDRVRGDTSCVRPANRARRQRNDSGHRFNHCRNDAWLRRLDQRWGDDLLGRTGRSHDPFADDCSCTRRIAHYLFDHHLGALHRLYEQRLTAREVGVIGHVLSPVLRRTQSCVVRYISKKVFPRCARCKHEATRRKLLGSNVSGSRHYASSMTTPRTKSKHDPRKSLEPHRLTVHAGEPDRSRRDQGASRRGQGDAGKRAA